MRAAGAESDRASFGRQKLTRVCVCSPSAQQPARTRTALTLLNRTQHNTTQHTRPEHNTTQHNTTTRNTPSKSPYGAPILFIVYPHGHATGAIGTSRWPSCKPSGRHVHVYAYAGPVLRIYTNADKCFLQKHMVFVQTNAEIVLVCGHMNDEVSCTSYIFIRNNTRIKNRRHRIWDMSCTSSNIFITDRSKTHGFKKCWRVHEQPHKL